MANKKYLVELTVDERAHLSGLIKKGKSSAQSNLKARVWTPRVMQAFSLDEFWQCGQVLTCVRPLFAALHTPRACMEIRRSGPNSLRALCAHRPGSGFPDPVSLT